VKSRAGRYAEVEVAIRSWHPYELPEIIAVSLTDGLAPYLQWLANETLAS
jgi:periplasmic divalent cation tolerance protein